MAAFILIFVIVCIYKMKITPEVFKNGYYNDYLSIEKTTSIKGIFIIIVFFSHFLGYVSIDKPIDNYAMLPVTLLGQGMVTMFMFYSGYGVMESIKKKGTSYVKKFPVNRLLATLFRFDIAIILFLIIGILLGNTITFGKVILSFIGWDSIGNSNWYIFVILILYLFTYISFLIFKNNQKLGAIGVLVLTLGYIFVLKYFDLKESWWYDTSLCYSLGMFYSQYKTKIERFINKNIVVYGGTFLILLFGYAVMRYAKSMQIGYGLAFQLIEMLIFTIIIVVLSMKVSFNNKILKWLGNHLFEIYVLQRIPMNILKYFDFNKTIYLYFILCFIATILLAWAYKNIIDKIWKKSSKRRKQGKRSFLCSQMLLKKRKSDMIG